MGAIVPFLCMSHLYSQESIDTNYIRDFKHLLTARLFLLNQDASVVFSNETDERIVYQPNVNFRLGIAGFYKWFGLGLSIKNPFVERNPDKYGHTTSIDWRINAYGRAYAAELFFQNFKGFYISAPVAEDGALFKLPDMKMYSFGITAYWIFNYKRFSIRAAFIQNEQQKKSAGSFIVSPFVNYYNIVSDTGIVPEELMHSYQIHASDVLKSGHFLAIGLAPGYSYSVVFLKHFYINGALLPGVYWQQSSYNSLTESRTSQDFAFFLNARIAAGFNSELWYIGASFISGINQFPYLYPGAKFYYDLRQMRFWVGTRFDLFRKKTKKI